MSTRPARPGEKGIIVCDDIAEGENIGKAVFVVKQCCMFSESHQVQALEPLVCYSIWTANKSCCSIGDRFCGVRKTSVIVQEDPDDVPTLTEIVEKETT